LIACEQVAALKARVEGIQQEFEEKKQEYKVSLPGLPLELRSMELEQLKQELEMRKTSAEEKFAAVEVWEKKQEQYQGRLQVIKEELSKNMLEESGLSAKLKVNRDNRLKAEKVLVESTGLLEAKVQEYSNFLRQIGVQSAAAELKRLAENDHRLNELQGKLDQTQQSKRSQQALLDSLKTELQKLETEKVKVESDRNNTAGQLLDKENKVKDLVGGAGDNIEQAIKEIDERLKSYTEQEAYYGNRIKDLENHLHGLTTGKSLTENQRDIYSGNLAKAEADLRKALEQKGFATPEEVEQSLLPKEEQETLREEINLYQQTEIEIRSQKETVQNKLGSRSITEEEWNDISRDYREMTVLRDRCVSESEVARNKYQTLKARHHRWLVLTKAANELNHRYGLFEQIYKLLRADRGKDNSFIDFIAEERLKYVAAKASETLGVMTKYKYALELDADAGFVIRDNANGGVWRMVTSLSGGETFLTSLSLALALSEQIQLKGQSPLEFFFLDEGFGTLDSSLLDAVIDSLERLSSKERVIGLISHVPELRDRLARRLIVDPPSGDGEGSTVRIEIA